MVAQKYRWDFIGLSTDEKPTASTSPKVTDGSTYYCSDNSKLYVWYNDRWYERKALGGGGGGGTSYTAGTGITIDEDTISVDDTTVQMKLTAGSNISISDGTISATDTTYSNFVGTDGTAGGTAGLVPAPTTSDTDKYLKSDGTWSTVSGGGSSVTVVQTTGTSTTDVMSQNATTALVYADPGTNTKIKIGDHASESEGTNAIEIGHYSRASESRAIAIGGGNSAIQSARAQSVQSIAIGGSANVATSCNNSIAIGTSASNESDNSVAIGGGAYVTQESSGSVAIGAGSITTFQTHGVVSVGNLGPSDVSNGYGYNNSAYRLITGVYDGQGLHDCATVAQGNTLASSAPTTSTVGVLGQLYTDTTNMHTYQLTAISGDTYTWTQRW